MADLLTNFAYAALTADVTAAATSIPVDETSRLPTNAQMAASDFYMTFDSTASLGAYEVVKVTAKSTTSGAGNLTVVRAQDGSTAAAHPSGTAIRAALTAGILTRLTALQQRGTATYTTASLAAGAQEIGTVALAKGYRLLRIQTSVVARTRLYATTAQRDADLTRAVGTDPTGDHGLTLDYITTASVLSASLSPLVDGYDGKATPDGIIPITVDNTGTSTTPITVTLTYVRTE